MTNPELETYTPTSQKDWREWLEENHQSKQSIWLIYYTKKSDNPSLTWREAVDEALCFGWIDSTQKKIDEFSFMQFFSKRKPKSIWSKINKDKVQELIIQNKMTQAGFESIEVAKKNGSWTILDEVEELIIPQDLEDAFKEYEGSKDYFLSQSKSVKKMILSWIVLAKRLETRHKHIGEIVESAGQNMKPKHMR